MKLFPGLILLLTISICTTFSAQTFLGISGGINTSNFSGDAPADASYNYKLGYSAGIVADFTLTEDVLLSLQPRYLQRGTTISYEKPDFESIDSLSITLDYLSFPVLVKILSLNKRVYFSSGLDMSYLTSATSENLMDGSTENIQELIKNYDLSVVFGFGLNFPVGITLLSFELRYSQSLLNISNLSEASSDDIFPYRFRTSGLQLLASFLYPL